MFQFPLNVNLARDPPSNLTSSLADHGTKS